MTTAIEDHEQPGRPSFLRELRELLNKYNFEARSNTPDWILADYMMRCLAAFEYATGARDAWFNPPPEAYREPLRPYRPNAGPTS